MSAEAALARAAPGAAPRLAFYGDDFTGATDALEVLASAGWRCALFLHPPDALTLARHPGLDAVGIAGDSRSMTPAEMDVRLPAALDWLLASGAPVVHYKVCSTFDSAPSVGSIGRVIELARPRLRQACVPIVAATPHLGRHCVYGHLFARSGTDGRVHRIDRHPVMSVHPVTPMDESDLSVHIARQGALSIAKASLDDVRAGPQVLLERIRTLAREGADAVLVDGLDERDLRSAGVVLRALGEPARPVFVVGGSGVEKALAAEDGAGGATVARAPAPIRQVLAVSGSASAWSATQIDRAIAAGFEEVELEPLPLLREPESGPTLARAAARIAGGLAAGRSVIAHTVRGPDDPRLAATRDGLRGLGLAEAAVRHACGPGLGAVVGELVARVLRAAPVPRLLLSGGDTSSAVARVLDVRAVDMAAALAPGVPLCRVLESARLTPGLEIAFKGGQMGGADFFTQGRG